jgi:hypothetical protein
MKANEEMPEWLAKQKEKNPFKVPENYFEDFEAGFLKKLKTKKVVKSKVVSLTGWYRYAAAAVISGLIVIVGFQLNGQWKSSEQMASFSNLEWDDVESELASFAAEDLISILNESDIETIESDLFAPNTLEIERFLLEDIQEEDLESLFN